MIRKMDIAFLEAAENNDVITIKKLLKEGKNLGLDINVQEEENGRTALMLAVRNGHLDIVKEFFKEGESLGLDINVHEKNGWTTLMLAVLNGHLDIVKEFLKEGESLGLDINVHGKNGRTALMLAAQYGHLDIINEFKKNGIGFYKLVDFIKFMAYLTVLAIGVVTLFVNPIIGVPISIIGAISSFFSVKDLRKKQKLRFKMNEMIKYEFAQNLMPKSFGAFDKSQGLFLTKISAYLKKAGRDEKFIKKFEEGYCGGISTLWAYAKWLQTQDNPGNKPRDDHEWFVSTRDMIAGWDGDFDKLKKDKKKIKIRQFENFISYIEFFQHPDTYITRAAQGTLDVTVKDTKGRMLKKEYSIGSLFTLEQLKELLGTENFIHDNRLFYIASHNHATSLFKKGEYYYYFDPNSQVGEIKTKDIDKVARFIFMANSFYYKKPSPLRFMVYSFDKGPKPKYPSVQDVLTKLNPYSGNSDYRHSDSHPKQSGLDMAVGCGSLDSVEYFLKKTYFRPWYVYDLITSAISHRQYKVVEKLRKENLSNIVFGFIISGIMIAGASFTTGGGASLAAIALPIGMSILAVTTLNAFSSFLMLRSVRKKTSANEFPKKDKNISWTKGKSKSFDEKDIKRRINLYDSGIRKTAKAKEEEIELEEKEDFTKTDLLKHVEQHGLQSTKDVIVDSKEADEKVSKTDFY